MPSEEICKRCNEIWKCDYYNFHDLCPRCFKLFDTQKMVRRCKLIFEHIQVAGFEDSDAWIEAYPYKGIKDE